MRKKLEKTQSEGRAELQKLSSLWQDPEWEITSSAQEQKKASILMVWCIGGRLVQGRGEAENKDPMAEVLLGYDKIMPLI